MDDSSSFENSTIELITIPFLLFVLLIQNFKTINSSNTVILTVVTGMLPNFIFFSTFNPIQSTQEIFTAKNSQIVTELKKMEEGNKKGWLVFPVIPGAILNGLGLKSFTHVLIQPQLKFFRAIFPEIPEPQFNFIFNRYAHIQLNDIQQPIVSKADAIEIPIRKIIGESQDENAKLSYSACNKNVKHEGSLDAIIFNNHKVYLSGWMLGNEHNYLSNLKTSTLTYYHKVPRLDISKVIKNVNFKDLINSGFSFEIQLTDGDIKQIQEEGFCLFGNIKNDIKQVLYYSPKEIESLMKINSATAE